MPPSLKVASSICCGIFKTQLLSRGNWVAGLLQLSITAIFYVSINAHAANVKQKKDQKDWPNQACTVPEDIFM